MDKIFYLLSYAAGVGGANAKVGAGPQVVERSLFLHALAEKKLIKFNFLSSISPQSDIADKYEHVQCLTEQLAKQVTDCVKAKKPFCVLGGDHTSAIGTFSGVYDALHHQGDIGLIWIDAHMDSHIPETSHSGNIHGMPLAALLGFGNKSLTQLLHKFPKIKPENVCLIGVRSFEPEEQQFLQQQKVKIVDMPTVHERGFAAVFEEALQYVKRNTIAFGVSLDLDAFDPKDAPGVDVPEPNGIAAVELLKSFAKHADDAAWVASEIVEFDPDRDQNHMTEKLIVKVIEILSAAKC